MPSRVPSRGRVRQAEIALPDWLRARILHLDPDLLVLDKPAGLPVSARSGETLEHWLPALRLGKSRLPQPAHRLDTDTAGCLALGRTAPMLARLNAAFAARLVGKTYWAVVRGDPGAAAGGESGLVDAPLAKTSSAARGWRMVVDPKGDPARSAWRVLGRGGGLCWLELSPETGRTHQLRVHCAHLGCPILGDALYGGGPAGAQGGGLHLLARALVLPLDPVLRVEAPVPAHMRAALAGCGG
ncbi:RluA family pseudouridine synthase [Falsiroseomonas selenitidurans]|uniref:RNA pseudouridine synthase n=1 Tax=Falsiroseomonas selenitidurans TaxID=2716335 RepID=A0ABX1E1E1_9PROT|nr:RNA pseudouridine synthase [Falsiroseomonas selenitidurans]NKC30974.1 RNA pseudouridine synthase [Falsiroseomonas selenitidurans]